MRQFQIAYTDDAAFRRSLDEIDEWCYANPAYVRLFHIYSEDMDLGHIQHICDMLDEWEPEALYLGCTTNANILDAELAAARVILTCTVFERETTHVELMQLTFLEQNVREDVERLREFIRRNPWVSCVEMHATIMDMSMKEFCDEMTKLPKEIQVFGGGAFNPNMDDDTAAVFSKGNGFLAHGIVFLMLGGADFHAYSAYISGWKPLRRRFCVTKAEREVLYELDGHPAFDVYHRFLGIQKSDKFFSNTLEFPLFMDRNDHDVLRCPLAVNEDGSFVMSSDMEEGSYVRMAYGVPDTILESICQDGQRIADFRPQVIEAFSCAARRAFWGDENISEETLPFRPVAATNGFYTHGEFLRIDGDMLNFNVTLVLAAMREGDPAEGEPVRVDNTSLEDPGKIPIISRFVSFIEASTAELEEINLRLALASVTDGLTRLYNRAEIERKIRGALDDRTAGKTDAPLSLIMLDIDNFKHVNDTYGHMEGDAVLKEFSEVLRNAMLGVHSYSTGRWGGEEFMVLLSQSPIEEAVGVAEKIRQRFQDIPFEAAGPQTVSIGVTAAREGEGFDSLCSRVDKALYAAKENGKNQVVRMD